MLKTIPPSALGQQALQRPITVLNRSLLGKRAVKKHQHEWGQLIYATQGILSVITSSGRFIVPPEQAVWVPPLTDHEIITVNDVTLASFYISVDEILQLPQHCTVLNISHLLKALISEASTLSQTYDWSGKDGRLLRLIRDYLIEADNIALQLPYPKDPRLIQITMRLQDEPCNNNTLEDWGKQIGASSRTLTRLFIKETGLSYREWKQRLKLQIAISMLSEQHEISAISDHLGYESVSAFTYMFRKELGLAPSFYAAQYK
ncbi:AraC family transcriptional regulator [Neptunomonas japonica]|uniref:AraC family transcriptional regulator n=1 Tax=Neptunomonas japonica TaxID=417574 RepID=UPI000406D46D|nr:helix-turn-helix transcriptional regulator [Neptunomonas japonica]